MEAWRFTRFYGEPDTNERMEAWNMLRMLNSKPHLPWVCMGDFNEIILTKEKRGGRVCPHCQVQMFLGSFGFLWFHGFRIHGSKICMARSEAWTGYLGTIG